jgi:TolB protein
MWETFCIRGRRSTTPAAKRTRSPAAARTCGPPRMSFTSSGRRFTPLRTAAPVGSPVSGPPENKYVYYASKQDGVMQIWRKMPHGSQPEQVTSNEFNNTSPHLSPDGKVLVFLSYSKNLRELPKGKTVSLRIMPAADKKIRALTTFVGGQGSLGTEPWSPGGRRLVYISYQSMK